MSKLESVGNLATAKRPEKADATVMRIIARIESQNKSNFEKFDELEKEFLRDRDALSAWIDRTGIPRRIVEFIEGDKFDKSLRTVEFIGDGVQRKAAFVGLLGGTGTGKTVASVWTLWNLRELAERARFEGEINDLEIGAFTTATRFCRIPTWEQDDHPLTTAKLLIVDDIGRESKEHRVDIEELFYRRYDDAVTTIFTSNLNIEALSEIYDDRFISRILEDGAVLEVEEVLRPIGQ